MYRDRLEYVGGTLVDVVEYASVTPDLGVKRAAPGVENTHHFPMATPKVNGVAHRQSRVRRVCVSSDDEFRKSGLEHATLDDLGVASNSQDVGRNATHLNVGVGAGTLQRKGRDHHDFGRD